MRTIQDITTLQIALTKQQEVGLRYFSDLTTPISRPTVDRITSFVRQTLAEMDPAFTCDIVGGYRRGKSACGDVDLLISHPVEGREIGVIKDISDRLTQKGFVKHIFSEFRAPSTAVVQGRRHTASHFDALEKAYVICVLPDEQPPVHRQLDLIVAPRSQRGTAILGWSGNTQYERSLRVYADKVKQTKFASHGLFIGPHRDQRLNFETEEEVLRYLGLPLIPPHLRNC